MAIEDTREISTFHDAKATAALIQMSGTPDAERVRLLRFLDRAEATAEQLRERVDQEIARAAVAERRVGELERKRDLTAEQLHRAEAQRDRLSAALRGVSEQACREWIDEKTNYCYEPAEFVLWGKLIPPEGLGPRCYDHAARHVGHAGLSPGSNYALIDLRPGLAALSNQEDRSEEAK